MAKEDLSVKISADTKQFEQKATEVEKQIEKIGKQKVNIKLSAGKESIAQLKEAISRIKANVDVKIKVDSSSVDKVKDSLARKKVTLNADVKLNTESVNKALERLANRKAKVEVTPVLAGKAEFKKQLSDYLKGIKSNIKISLNTGSANSALQSLQNKIKSLNRTVNVKVNTSQTGTTRESTARGRTGGGSSQQMGVFDNVGTSIMSNIGRATKGFGSFLESASQVLIKMQKTGGAVGNIATGLIGVGATLATIYALSSLISSAFSSIVQFMSLIGKSGLDFTREMQTSEIGIAAILKSMTLRNDKEIEFQEAMNMSNKIMETLKIKAIQTSASMQDLVTTFQGIVAPAIASNMSLDQIMEFTSVGVNAIKAMGLNSTQFVQELRDLVQGGITAQSSTLARSLGLTDADIEKARSSAEGLFNFLMKRMSGFSEVENYYVDTFAGMFSRLEEFSTLASAEITKSFASELSFFTKEIINMIGTIQGTEFVPSDSVKAFVGFLKEAYLFTLDMYDSIQERLGVIKGSEGFMGVYTIVSNILEITWELVKGVGKVTTTLTYLTSAFLDFAPIKFLINLLNTVLDKIKSVIEYGNKAQDYLQGGIRRFRGEPELASSRALAEERMRLEKEKQDAKREASKNVSLTGLTPKFKNDQDKRIKESQNALKEVIEEVKDALAKLKDAFNEAVDKLDVKLYNKEIDQAQYEVLKLQEEKALAEKSIAELLTQKQAILSAQYKPEDERNRQNSLRDLDTSIEKFGKTIKNADEVLNKYGSVGSGGSGGAISSNLGEKIVEAGRKRIGRPYEELKCTELVIESWDDVGLVDELRSAGIDLLDAWTPTLVENAKKLGVFRTKESGYVPKAGDIGINYDDVDYGHAYLMKQQGLINSPTWGRTVYETAQNAVELYGEDVVAGYISLEDVLRLLGKTVKQGVNTQVAINKEDIKVQKAREEVLANMRKTMEEYNALFSDVSTINIDKTFDEYNKTIKLFNNTGKPELARMATVIRDYKIQYLKFQQNSKNIELEMQKLGIEVGSFLGSIATGYGNVKEMTKATSNIIKREVIDKNIAEMSAISADLKSKGMFEKAFEIDKKIAETTNNIYEYFSKIIDGIDKRLETQKAFTSADYSLTSRQRENITKQQESVAYSEKADVAKEQLKALTAEYNNLKYTVKNDLEANALYWDKIVPLQQFIKLNEELAKIPTLLDEVELSAKQSLEDGLVELLTEGVNEAESLSEAFNNLIVNILKGIQKVFAEKITDDIVGAIFPKSPDSTPKTPTLDNGMLQANANNLQTGLAMAEQTIRNALINLSTTFANITNQVQMTAQNIQNTASTSSGFSFKSAFGIDYDKKASGGYVSGAGTGTSDSIPTMLSNGEYVIKASRVKALGIDFLHSLNSGRAFNFKMPKFANGGLVGEESYQATARGMTSFARDVGTNVSNKAELSLAIVRDEQAATEHFLKSSKGQKMLIDFNNQNSKIIRSILR